MDGASGIESSVRLTFHQGMLDVFTFNLAQARPEVLDGDVVNTSQRHNWRPLICI